MLQDQDIVSKGDRVLELEILIVDLIEIAARLANQIEVEAGVVRSVAKTGHHRLGRRLRGAPGQRRERGNDAGRSGLDCAVVRNRLFISQVIRRGLRVGLRLRLHRPVQFDPGVVFGIDFRHRAYCQQIRAAFRDPRVPRVLVGNGLAQPEVRGFMRDGLSLLARSASEAVDAEEERARCDFKSGEPKSRSYRENCRLRRTRPVRGGKQRNHRCLAKADASWCEENKVTDEV